jgi:hypothetical protein
VSQACIKLAEPARTWNGSRLRAAEGPPSLTRFPIGNKHRKADFRPLTVAPACIAGPGGGEYTEPQFQPPV